MVTQPVRVSAETVQAAQQISGLLGTTPGRVLDEAFHEYVVKHRQEITEAFEHAKKYIESQDRDGLLKIVSGDISERAEQAAVAAAKGRD